MRCHSAQCPPPKRKSVSPRTVFTSDYCLGHDSAVKNSPFGRWILFPLEQRLIPSFSLLNILVESTVVYLEKWWLFFTSMPSDFTQRLKCAFVAKLARYVRRSVHTDSVRNLSQQPWQMEPWRVLGGKFATCLLYSCFYGPSVHIRFFMIKYSGVFFLMFNMHGNATSQTR